MISNGMNTAGYWWGRIVTVFNGEGEMGSRVARGSLVLFLGRFAIKGVYFVRTVVLARLLFPEDFGLFGLAALSLGFTSVFFTSGLNSSFVYSKEDPKKYLDAMWTVGIIRNTLLAVIICATATLFGAFFENPAIVPMIYVLSLSTFFVAFENVGIVLLEKELRFNRKFLFDISTVALEVISVIIAAFVLHSAWALVIGAVANRIIGSAISYFFHPYRPRLTSDLSGAWELFRYGKWVSMGAILVFLISQGDNVVIGKLLTPEQLGFYQLAFTLAFIPALEFSRVFGNILFPLFAKLEQDLEALKRAFIKSSRLIFAVATPMSFGLLVVLPEFVRTFYGERWMPMVEIANVLIIYGLIRSIEFIAKPLLMGIGRPKMTLVTQIAQFAGMFLFIVPLTHLYGVVGTAWAVVIGGAASVGVLLSAVHRHFHFSFSAYLDMFGVSTLSALLMYGTLSFLKGLFPIVSPFFLFSYIAFGALFYVIALFLLDRLFGGRIADSLLLLRSKL